MTLPDLHPDELLAREAQGPLTPTERADLEAHLLRCPGCALERAVRSEASHARAPSDNDHAVAARAVEAVLAGRSPDASPIPLHWTRRLRSAAGLFLLLISTAVGASTIAVRVRERQAAHVEPTRSIDPTLPTPKSIAPAHPRRVASASPPEPDTTAAAPEIAVTEPTAVEPVAPAIRRRLPEPRPAQPENVPPPAEPATLAVPPAIEDAAIVFRRAEVARGDRRYAVASHLYDDLASRFAGSREEIVARVLYAQLLLDQLNQPQQALARFESYLATAPAGALAEEAQMGRAQALGKLGRGDEERACWTDFLRRYPTSVHAAAARARLTP